MSAAVREIEWGNPCYREPDGRHGAALQNKGRKANGALAALSVKSRLEFYSEAGLSLSILWHIALGSLTDHLTECARAGVAIRVLELSTVERVEVIHLQDALEALAYVEVFPDVHAFVVQGWVA